MLIDNVIFCVFQESFTCARPDDAVPCEMAPTFYNLNDNFGVIPEKTEQQS